MIIIKIIMAVFNLLVQPVKDEQKQWRKDHCLNKYESDDWKDELFW